MKIQWFFFFFPACSSFISVSVIKHPNKITSGKKQDYFSSQFQLTGHDGEKVKADAQSS